MSKSDNDINIPNWNKLAYAGERRPRYAEKHRPASGSYENTTYKSAVNEIIQTLPTEDRQAISDLPGKQPLITSLLETVVENMGFSAVTKQAERIRSALMQHDVDELQASQTAASLIDACVSWTNQFPEKKYVLQHDQQDILR